MKNNYGIVELSKCPACGYDKLDSATGAYNQDVTPRPGDLTICIKCGELLIFTETLGLRLPTQKEHAQYSIRKDIIAMQILIRGRSQK